MQPDSSLLQAMLEADVILLDTSFAMADGFEDFCGSYLTASTKLKIIIPVSVDAELQKFQLEADPSKQKSRARARKVAKVLSQLIASQAAQVVGDSHANTLPTDAVIKFQVSRMRLSKRIVVLTNEKSLVRDIEQINGQQSAIAPYHISTFSFNSKTPSLKAFEISEDARPSKPWNTKSSKTMAQPPRSAPEFQYRPTDRPAPFIQVNGITSLSQSPLAVIKDELLQGDKILLADGSVCLLGKRLGSGGEGIVFEVQGMTQVCKLYFKDRLTEAAKAKVELLVTRRIDHPGICWPSQAVYDTEKQFRGFLMPRADGVPLRQSLFLPRPFMQKNPTWTRLNSTRLAIKILQQIQFLHNLGVTLGDINPLNFLLCNNGDVFLVDCDSFQVEGFPCPVGTVNFTPPELQGVNFKSILRTPEHEMFAVATLLFMIFLPGNCPYTHTGGEDGGANIRRGEFVYTTGWVRGGAKAPMGVWRYCWAHLTTRLKKLFESTFDAEKKTERRPTISDWLSALIQYERILSDPKNVFMGPKPVNWGHDLSIMPQSVYYNPEYGNNNQLPTDGKTGYERLQEEAVRELMRVSAAAAPTQAAPVYSSSPYQPSSPAKSQQAKPIVTAAKNQSDGCGCIVLIVIALVVAGIIYGFLA